MAFAQTNRIEAINTHYGVQIDIMKEQEDVAGGWKKFVTMLIVP